jgi:hypothetical protein
MYFEASRRPKRMSFEAIILQPNAVALLLQCWPSGTVTGA